MNFIPYGKQSINQDDIESVVEVLKSDYLTTGSKVPEFEKAIANIVVLNIVWLSQMERGLYILSL